MEKQSVSIARILSRSGEPFLNRVEAGRLLARELGGYRDQKTVVIGIPRGGIIIAREIAKMLKADLDIVLAHKLRTPGQGELAMGSISEHGDLFLNQDVIQQAEISNRDIEEEKNIQKAEIERRIKLFRSVKPRVPLKGKIIIVTDDGVATGATTKTAIQAVHAENPKKVVLAVPVGSEETLRELSAGVDEIICLKSPPYLSSVGQVYLHFEEVTDQEVLDILRNYRVKNVSSNKKNKSD